MRTILQSYKELGAVGVGSSVSHTKEAVPWDSVHMSEEFNGKPTLLNPTDVSDLRRRKHCRRLIRRQYHFVS